MYYISFPGLGIEPFHINRTAFSVFGHGIAWYGILITFGMVLAVLLAMHLCKREGISSDDIVDLAFTVIVFGVIGARAYYVIFSWNEINYVATGGTAIQNILGTIYNCIAVWEGGLAIYGGVLGGLISALVFSKIKKINYLKLTDILAPCVLVGQIVGRWGNFINVEAYGGETTLPWRMGISYMVNGSVMSEKFVHPTFLYESLWNLCVITVILILYRKKKFDGQMSATYFIGYGIGSKDFGIANCVRAFLGDTASYLAAEEEPYSCDDTILSISCNIDDMTGEALGLATEIFMAAGALDVFTIPIQMKKNRPGILLTCLCEMEEREKFTGLFFLHTSTRGVRYQVFERAKLESTFETRKTSYGNIRIKKSSGYGIQKEKAEFEDLKSVVLKNHCALSLNEIEKSLH